MHNKYTRFYYNTLKGRDYTLYVKELSNGLKFYIEQNDGDFVAISYCVNAGSFDEPIDKLGIAHLTEHLVFKGTMNRNAQDVFKDVEKLGGSLNAYTTETNTVFETFILKEYWKEALDVVSDIVWNNTIPEDEFSREQNVVAEEIKMYFDNGSRRIYDVMTKTAFINTPNKWNNGGTVQTVLALTKQDVEDFIDNYYIPSNIKVYVSGNVDPDAVVDYVKNYIENLKFNDSINYYRNDELPVKHNDCLENIDSTQSHLIMYLPISPIKDFHDWVTASIALDIFGNGFGSRLMELREKYGYAYTIRCDDFFAKPESLIYAYIGLNHSNIKNTKKMMVEKLKEIHDSGATQEEFESAFNIFMTSLKRLRLEDDSKNDFRIRMGSYGIDLDRIDFDEIMSLPESVTLNDINAFYENAFDESKVGFITLLQTKTEE